MKINMIISLLTLISITFAGQVQIVYAVEKDVQLRLSDESKQELNRVLQDIKYAVNNTSTTNALKYNIYKSTYYMSFDDCKIKYIIKEINASTNEAINRYKNSIMHIWLDEYTFNLSDFKFAEEYIDSNSNYVCSRIYAKSNSRGFKKAVQFQRKFSNDGPFELFKTMDSVDIRVNTFEQAQEITKAFNKALKLCADN
jgi:hypothetical protein